VLYVCLLRVEAKYPALLFKQHHDTKTNLKDDSRAAL